MVEQHTRPLVSLADAERRAVSLLPPMVLGYYASGAEDETTLADNLASWRRWRILPRVLVDVSRVDTRAALCFFSRGGADSSFKRLLPLSAPILVAPMAMMKLAHREGEIAMARAARAAGLGMVVSTMGTTPLEEVRRGFSAPPPPPPPSSSSSSPPPPSSSSSPPPPLLFQLYVTTDRAFCESLVRRAEGSGYDALVVTVDVPVLGKREADERLGFGLPPGLELANLRGLSDSGSSSGASSASVGATTAATKTAGATKAAEAPGNQSNEGSRLAALFQRQIDASLTFDFLRWLRSRTALPIWVKGVLHPDDASAAVAAGADGIVVSNHGGRQLDGAPAAADVLEAVVAAVRRSPRRVRRGGGSGGGGGGRGGGGDRGPEEAVAFEAVHIPVLVDGGIRRGSDVLRALALGADAVLLGRPALYGLALAGERGALEVLSLLKAELERAMALSGCARVSDVSRGLLLGPGEVPMKPRL
jgi:isopentenyl diphosphate isomerase/L-lactate dehydrogenase-like FMN-dependent dehydrogenase